ncbi:MAG TPA: hypothetical protein VNI54_00985 [Thermoanaerobaculia bacterium]|nr:hypothetical protein [Thermoanaerobaculia bacterium]
MSPTQSKPDRNEQLAAVENRKYTFAEIRRILFPDGPPKRHTLEELRDGIEDAIREEHGRG